MRALELLNKSSLSLQEREEFEREIQNLFESFIKDPETYYVDVNYFLEELEQYSPSFERVYLSKGARIDTEMVVTLLSDKYYVRYTPRYDFYICREIIPFEKVSPRIKEDYDFVNGNNCNW